ncbi:MAG: glutamate--tRNA ligase [Candidatus Moranbacteria bacterium]|nr:glutamate--tRNA ligase [Candidatus Moranbacteria bacterium]
MKNNKEVRVRFAPSPTGELHIGGLRTALTNFLFARNKGGKMILRIEDTDRNRLVEGATDRIIEAMNWAGIEIDEGVCSDGGESTCQKGEFGPYVQSERKGIYQKYVDKLVEEKKAYPCFCSSERLEEMREEQMKNKQAPGYDGHCRELSQEEVDSKIKNGEPHVVRFKVSDSGTTLHNDLVFGKIEVENRVLDDFVIMKSDGFPTYHLACVVDDHLMKISHVFRGAEWIASTPKHILLYEAFGWTDEMPSFCHMPSILNKNKKKLSKREGSVSVADFKNEGYPPEALVNFIALLGWNPKTEQEIFSMEELIDQFSIEKIHRAGGVFDLDRLAWISAQHIKKMSTEDLYVQSLPFLEKKEFFKNAAENRKTKDFVKKLLEIEKERMEKFTQVGEKNQFFFSDDIEVNADDMRWKDSKDTDTKENLQKGFDVLEKIGEDDWKLENIESTLLEAAGDKRGDLLFPVRAALTGQKRSPSPFQVAWVLGREESLKRIKKAIDSL